MPETDSLPTVSPRVDKSRRRIPGRAFAVIAALGVSLTIVNAVVPEEAGTASAAEISDKPRHLVDADGNLIEFTAFTPREAQMPQIVPEPVLWEQHRLAVEAAREQKRQAEEQQRQAEEQRRLAEEAAQEQARLAEEAAQEQARLAAEAARPKTVRPTAGVLTSGYGHRWGSMHAGLDFGDPLGAPIASVTDGVVIEAGPASGFGLWVRIQQDDGSIGVYGHMNDILVNVGQHVRAGDVIATVGSRGYSTGPHLHYEVHVPGVGPVDPAGWLSARGIDVHHH